MMTEQVFIDYINKWYDLSDVAEEYDRKKDGVHLFGKWLMQFMFNKLLPDYTPYDHLMTIFFEVMKTADWDKIAEAVIEDNVIKGAKSEI